MTTSNLIVELTLGLLLLLSIATWSIAAIKWRAFRAEAKASRAYLDLFRTDRSWLPRIKNTRNGVGDFAALGCYAINACHELKQDEPDAESQELQDVLERELRKESNVINRRRERGLAELASIGSISPFIGLFGTVWGIMNALKTITATGQASIDVVAGPIGEALIATAVGIATAIPAVLAYNYFLRQQRVHVTELNGFAEDFLRHAMRNRKHWGES